MTTANFPLITIAKTENASEICALVNSAYRGESSKEGWTTEADLLGGMRIDVSSLLLEIADPRKKILCLRDSPTSELLGCVCLETIDDEAGKGKGYYLGMLAVKPGLQTRGIGKALMKAAEEFAKASGASRIILGVIHVRAELIAWYERRGYRKNGVTKPFPYESPLVRDPKRTDLEFVFLEKDISTRATF